VNGIKSIYLLCEEVKHGLCLVGVEVRDFYNIFTLLKIQRRRYISNFMYILKVLSNIVINSSYA